MCRVALLAASVRPWVFLGVVPCAALPAMIFYCFLHNRDCLLHAVFLTGSSVSLWNSEQLKPLPKFLALFWDTIVVTTIMIAVVFRLRCAFVRAVVCLVYSMHHLV